MGQNVGPTARKGRRELVKPDAAASREQKRDTDATGKSAGQPAVTNYNGSSDNENKGPNLALEERIKQALLSETVMAALVKAIAESITGDVTQRVAESITEDVTQRVTESITEDVTQRVYDSDRPGSGTKLHSKLKISPLR